jgi:serine protease Do
VTIQPVGPKEAKALGLQRAQGALISQVQPGSPAERAGLAPGDVILSIDGKRVEDSRDVQFRIAAIAPGTKVKLGIFRDGRELEMVATLAEMPDDLRSGRMEGAPGSGLDGVDVEELTPELVRQLGLGRQTTGVVVTYVDPSSAAAEAGLSRGDVIQEVNRIRVKNVASFERVLKQAGNKPILLLVNRRGTTQYVVVEPR